MDERERLETKKKYMVASATLTEAKGKLADAYQCISNMGWLLNSPDDAKFTCKVMQLWKDAEKEMDRAGKNVLEEYTNERALVVLEKF
jgi:hypothetical protein